MNEESLPGDEEGSEVEALSRRGAHSVDTNLSELKVGAGRN